MRTLVFKICFVIMLICCPACRNPNQIAKIKYEIQGCFGSEKSELFILKKEENTFAKLTTEGKKTLETKLNVVQMDSLNSFIKELKIIKGGFCTTAETFTVYLSKATIHKTIMECEWDGFFNLKQFLFHRK